MNSKMFREELERVVGDSLRESGTDGISALLSDVMNIKNGSTSSAIIPSTTSEAWKAWPTQRTRNSFGVSL